MKLKSKLQRLKTAGPESRGASPAPPEPPPDPSPAPEDARLRQVDALRSEIARVLRKDLQRAPTPAIETADDAGGALRLPGEERTTPMGRLHCIERWLEPGHCHGHAPVGDAWTADSELIARLALDPGLAAIDPTEMLLVDTETTGLSGGTGTLPFLLGLAFFEDGALCLRQLLLKSPGEEVPLLGCLADRLSRASCIVTYNGKSFDWPLLRNRFILNRMAAPALPPHIDLLHCARRVLRPRLGATRLVDVEARVLGFVREGDVDGSLIPDIYWRFVRRGHVAEMLRVLEHNAHDVIALAAMLGTLLRHFEEVRHQDDPRDHLAYAKVAWRARDEERATRFARAAAEGGGDARMTAEAWALDAKLAQRRGELDEALHGWTRALHTAEDEATRSGIHLALAKLYEHKRKDPAAALSHAHHTAPVEGEEACDRRVARLRHKSEAS